MPTLLDFARGLDLDVRAGFGLDTVDGVAAVTDNFSGGFVRAMDDGLPAAAAAAAAAAQGQVHFEQIVRE
jgi:hypothetical protein